MAFFFLLFSESLTGLQLLIHKSISSTRWRWMSHPSTEFVWNTLGQRICLVVQWAPRWQKPKSWCKGHRYSCNPWPGNFRPFYSKFILIVKHFWLLHPNKFPWRGKKQEAFKIGQQWLKYVFNFQGNVALDVARILLRPTPELATTDIASHALEALQESSIRFLIFEFIIALRSLLLFSS